VFENIYISKKKCSSNEAVSWKNRENGVMQMKYYMVRTGP